MKPQALWLELQEKYFLPQMEAATGNNMASLTPTSPRFSFLQAKQLTLLIGGVFINQQMEGSTGNQPISRYQIQTAALPIAGSVIKIQALSFHKTRWYFIKHTTADKTGR